jgi:phosphatidylserine synthase
MISTCLALALALALALVARLARFNLMTKPTL